MFPIVRYVPILLFSALALLTGCSSPELHQQELPNSVGYLRASGPTFGKLIILDADNFEIHKTVDMPQALRGRAHGIERDDRGRLWIGYSQEKTSALPWFMKEEVLVLSPTGEVEHELQTECGPPEGGIAFSNGYAFIGCVWSGSKGQLVVVDMETTEVVKTIEAIRPEGPGLSDRRRHRFFLGNVKEIAGNILVFGSGVPPLDYKRITNSRNGVAMIATVDQDTLEIREYKTDFPPGSKILDAVEVDGMAWLLNLWSHIPERPPRTDIYVMDPGTLEIVETFNLAHPYPLWGKRDADGSVYIVHASYRRGIISGQHGGVTRIDPETREETFWRFGPDFGNRATYGFDINQGQPCIAKFSGLWCLNSEGDFKQMVSQEDTIGILFAKSRSEKLQRP